MDQAALDFSKPVSRAELALECVATCPHLYREDFAAWLSENWAVYLAFERESLAVHYRGRSHYGANTIIEYLRHQTLLADQDGEWKMNDRWTSSLARLFAAMNPECANLFEFRERKFGVVKAPAQRAA